jgi:PAS domain S-box-containing protein
MDRNITKVLIVEDDAIIAKNLSQILQKSGYEPVAMISKGGKVVDAVKQYMPDIILMDILLNDDITGIAAAGAVNAFSDIPIIFITSNFQPEFADKAIMENPYGYIIKPFRETEIKYAIMLADQKTTTIRQLKKNQTELNRLKEFYNTVLNSMTDWVIVVNRDSEIVYSNDSFNYTFGKDNPTASFMNFIEEESEKNEYGMINIIFLTGRRDLRITSIKNINDEIRTFNVGISPITDENSNVNLAIISGRDISELIENMDYLTSIRSILNNIIQSVPTGIILTNSKGTITLTNKTFELLSGFTSSELEGRDIPFLQMQPSQITLPSSGSIGSVNHTPVELELKKKDSGSFTARILILNFEKPLNENFKTIYFITDITFEKKLEAKQVRLQNYIESIVREMDDLSELLLETNVYNQSIKRGDIDFDPVDRNILKFIESGMTNNQIAIRLEIAEITVKKRLSVIYSRLGIKNRYQLIEYLHTNFVAGK